MGDTLGEATGERSRRLMLIFTRGVSLKIWDRVGMLEREVELYKRLIPHLAGISFLTYGGEDELGYQQSLDGITILPNRWNLSPTKFSLYSPVLLRDEFRKVDIIKTNQINGAWTAILAKMLYGKKTIVRCGYLYSDFQRRIGSGLKAKLSLLLERLCLRLGDACVVATVRDATYIRERHGVKPGKIHVVPNYVDTALFRPAPGVKREKGLVCFVGRLSPQKNVEMLFETCGGLKGVRLLIIGDGLLREKLRGMAEQFRLNVEFHSSIPNSKLPDYLNRASMFVLPSHYEGCPKTLLEAMACELPVIGTDVQGIREIIRNGENGILCEKTAEGIARAILMAFSEGPAIKRMGQKAREYVMEHHSLERVVEMELGIMRQLHCGGQHSGHQGL